MSDKVFTKKITMSICLILLCLCALSISAGAFFSDTSSLNKTYSTATYDLTITATKQVTTLADSTANPPVTETVVPDASVSPDPSEPHKYTLTVLPDTKAEGEGSLSDKEVGYSVNIAIKDGVTATSASGYCKIVITYEPENADPVVSTYYSKQIAVANHADADITTSRSLKIVADVPLTVEFIPLWGTYSGVNGDPLNVGDTISIDSAGASSIIPVTTDSGAGSSTDTSGD
ncbi:MAG: hypothetical protein IJU94_04495 [Clostridia bacterium]|nr:hypothetical protein [Clostridia bacterium]